MVVISIFLSGMLGVCAQVFILKSLVASLGVNEFFVAVFLGLWVVSEGVGAFFAGEWFWKRFLAGRGVSPVDFFAWTVWGCGVSFVFSLVWSPWARVVVGADAGVAVGLWDAILVFAVFGGVAAFFHGAGFSAGCLAFEWYDSGVALLGRGRRRSPDVPSGERAGGAVYLWESAGSLAGGALSWAVFLLAPEGAAPRPLAVAAAAVAFGAIFSAAFLARRPSRRALLLATVLAAAAAAFAAAPARLIAWRHNPTFTTDRHQRFLALDTRITPYQTLTLIKTSDDAPEQETNISATTQYTIFSDGKPAYTAPDPDPLSSQELIDYTLLMTTTPPVSIAMIGIPATEMVVSFFNNQSAIKEITVIEPDRAFINMAKKIAPALNHPRIRIIPADPLNFLSRPPARYDAIILNAVTPSSLLQNRLFTEEFFRLAFGALSDGKESILVFRLPGSSTYLNPETARLNLAVLGPAMKIFPSVYSIPAQGGLSDVNIYFCIKNTASPLPPSVHIFDDKKLMPLSSPPPDADTIYRRALAMNLKSSVVARSYLTSRFSPINRISYEDALKREITHAPFFCDSNKALRPVASFYATLFENSQHAPRAYKALRIFPAIVSPAKTIIFSSAVMAVSVIICIIFLPGYRIKISSRTLKRRIIYFSMISVGFAGMSSALMIMFIFQTTYGYIYGLIGLLTASFMGGSTLGAAFSNHKIYPAGNPEPAAPLLPSAKRIILYAQTGVAISSLVFAALAIILTTTSASAVVKTPIVFYLIISGVAGFISGMPYPAALAILYDISENPSENHASGDKTFLIRGGLYAAELTGGFVAGLLSGIILLPLAGIPVTFFMVASLGALNVSLIYVFLRDA